jgi:hypothetical protein
MTTVNVTRGDTTIVRIITAGPQGPAGGGGGGAGTDLSYDAATRTIASSTGADAVLPVATTALAGLESAADKTKLDSITVDSATLVRKYVRNNSGAGIPKGAAVYQTGSSGTTITVALADASAEATAAQTLGLAQESIAHNANGYVVAVGLLDGISTAALTEGQIVWLSETAGEGTSTRPTQPAHGVVLGYCVKQGPGTSGILYVKVDNGLELEELHDVLIVGATAGQVLRRASDGLWKNAQLAASDLSGLGGAATLNVGTTAGTVAAGDDSRITGALSAATAATTYQPLDADLTSIAALTTTTFGRSLLTQADAAAARTTLGAGTGNGTVTGVTATGLLTSSGGTAPQISSSIATNSLAGRFSAGTGALEAITIGSGLAISGGALVVTAGGTGTVTSVGLSLPGIFSVAGSPVTTAGTLTATLATQAANLIFAGPSSGAAAAPTFRALVTADLPSVIQPSAELTLPLNAPGSPTARDIYAVADTIRYRDSANNERLLLNATDNLANLSNTTTARNNIGAAASGAIGSSGLTMATARLLGRTTASTGAPEEITVGSGLSLSAGTLTATGGGGSVTNYQEFTSSGTWTKPSGCTFYYAEVIGGGGGGGGGRSGLVSTGRAGGGGGSGGTRVFRWGLIADLGATESVVIGAGGTAGASVTGQTNGGAGGSGGTSSFGSVLFAPGGGGGNGGGTGTTSGGTIGFRGNAAFGAGFAGAGGGTTATAGSTAGSIGAYGPGGGGGGGSISTADALLAAAAGGSGSAINTSATTATTGGGGAAGTAGGAGSVGTSASDGGGGGASSITAAAGAGAAGTFPGGGGGGGGAVLNGAGASGAGAAGANGVVRIWCW